MFDLADTLLRDTEFLAEGCERDALFAEAALLDDHLFAVGEAGEGFGKPGVAGGAVARDHHGVFGQRAAIGQQVLPFGIAFFADRSVEGAISSRQARAHVVDFALVDAEGLGDGGAVFRGEAAIARVVEQGAQAAQIEEEGLLGGGRTRADDRPVAQYVVLHAGTDPPGGIGGEAEFALGLEA